MTVSIDVLHGLDKLIQEVCWLEEYSKLPPVDDEFASFFLKCIVRNLSQAESKVIHRYYGLSGDPPVSMAVIATEIDRPLHTVRALKQAALSNLRDQWVRRQIFAFLNGSSDNRAIMARFYDLVYSDSTIKNI